MAEVVQKCINFILNMEDNTMENEEIVLRLATIGDAASIALLGRITFKETFGNLFSDRKDLLDYLERTFSVTKIKKGIIKRDNVFFIAMVSDLPVGYGKLKLNSKNSLLNAEKSCQLQKIYVLRDFLSLGIGRKLQNSLFMEAMDKGFSTIWLSVLNSNLKAIDFYKRSDYQCGGFHKYTIGKENFEFCLMYKILK